MKLPYSEGSVFLVPLKSVGYARGVVARSNKEGRVILGYFFGPCIAAARQVGMDDLHPKNAILCLRFGDLGLMNGEWRIVGTIPNWDRSQWPMPDFVRRDPLGYLKPRLVHYSDTDPLCITAEHVIEDDTGMPTDSMSGYGAVEIKLARLLI